MDSIILIPAYKPDIRLVLLVEKLSKVNQLKILVINNGNSKDFDEYFYKIEKLRNVYIIKIKQNSGKGNGIKEGLYRSYFEGGNIQQEGYYRDGLKDGSWKKYDQYYNRDRKIAHFTSDEYIFKNGKLINITLVEKQHNLPQVFGNFNVNELLKLHTILNSSGFNLSKIKKYYYFQSNRWDIEYYDSTVIMLPSYDLEKSLKNYIFFINKKKIIPGQIIDLRMKNKIIVTNAEG